MKIDFTKMHGLGNDFVLIDCRSPESGVDSSEMGALSRRLCHRRFGIGADQLLLLYPSRAADFRMRIFNSDGSEVEMCGNGIRCFAKYIWDRGISDKKVIEVETLAGIIRPEKINDLIRVDMGEPIFEPEKIPVNLSSEFGVRSSEQNSISRITHNASRVIDYPLQIEDKEFRITCLSMGNPHAVIFVDNLSGFNVAYYGSKVENHPLFPKRVNAEFVEVLSPSEIKMRVWERGSGETMACGTGASAAAVASNIKGLTGKSAAVRLEGGELFIDWADDNHVYMKGLAAEVFTGTVHL